MDASNLNGDSLLSALGLRRASSTDWVTPVTGAFLAGLAVGGVLGLLLAPKSGSDLRLDLRRRYGEARDDLGSAVKKATQIPEEPVMPNERSTRY